MIFTLFLILAILGQAGDFFTTFAGQSHGLHEANPVVRFLLNYFPVGFVVLKLIYLTIAIALGTWALALTAALGWGLTILNYRNLRKAGFFTE